MSDHERIERLENALRTLISLLSVEDALQPWVVRALYDLDLSLAQTKAPSPTGRRRTMADRAAFEAWARSQGWRDVQLARSVINGNYSWSGLNSAWAIWQEAARQERERCGRDAERYKVVREGRSSEFDVVCGPGGNCRFTPEGLDNACDRAMDKEQK